MPKGDGGGRNNGGKKPGAGRKSGVPNKISREDREKARASGILPLEVILRQMRKYHDQAERLATSKKATTEQVQEAEDRALTAAKEAAPYLHHKLQAIQHKTEPLDLSKLTDEELRVVIAIKQRLGNATGNAVH